LPTIAGTYTFEATYNGITCSKTFKVNCGSLGIDQLANINEQLTVYPNPAGNNVTIQSSTELGIITIYNSLGEIVLQIKSKNIAEQIDISTLSPGIFTIRTQNRQIKLVKQ